MRAVAWYCQAAEAGTPPDLATFLARFPDLRLELESFLADKGTFDRAAGPPAVRQPDPDATLPPSANNDTATLTPASSPHRPHSHHRTRTPPSRGGLEARIGTRPVRSVPSGTSRDYELLSGDRARKGMGVVFRAPTR